MHWNAQFAIPTALMSRLNAEVKEMSSGQDRFNYLAMHVGEPAVAAVVAEGEPFVIDAAQVQQRGVQVVAVERHLGADEIHRGKRQKFYTVLSDLVHGEVIGLAPDRTEKSLAGLLTTRLDARQRAAVEAVCTDMHRPYLNAAADVARGHRRARQVSRRAACGRGPG